MGTDIEPQVSSGFGESVPLAPGQRFPIRIFSSPQGHSAMSGDILGCHNSGKGTIATGT